MNHLITEMDIDIQRQKALKVLAIAKKIENQKIGYKFVRIDYKTRVFRKL